MCFVQYHTEVTHLQHLLPSTIIRWLCLQFYVLDTQTSSELLFSSTSKQASINNAIIKYLVVFNAVYPKGCRPSCSSRVELFIVKSSRLCEVKWCDKPKMIASSVPSEVSVERMDTFWACQGPSEMDWEQNGVWIYSLFIKYIPNSNKLITVKLKFHHYLFFTLPSVIYPSSPPSSLRLSSPSFIFSPSRSSPSSSKLRSFWMSRFYERSDKEKGNEGQRGKERWRTDGDGDLKNKKS